MDHRVTQCPRCGTSFRVTEAHLAVAAGAVRCGSCLHIFNARDHWTETAVPAPEPRTAQPVADIDIDDDLLIDDNTPLFDDEDADPGHQPLFNASDTDFSDLEMAAARQDKQQDSLLDLDNWQQESNSLFRELGASGTDIDEEADEQWAQRLLADAEREESALATPPRDRIFDDFDDAPREPRLGALAEGGYDIDDLSPEFLDIPATPGATSAPAPEPETPEQKPPAPEPRPEEIAMEPMRAEPRNAEPAPSLFDDFETEPLQLHPFAHEPRWPKVLWGIGFLAALLLLAGQYLYFNLDTLARGPLRPWLANVCSALDCRLPAQSDANRIQTGSLIVRSHPSERGVLAVDALITNQAGFPQPYPELQLQFTDLNGAPVAGRRFKPEEYLGGELTGARLMPVQQPVHIALELLDPGPRAVNYLLTVVPISIAP